MTAGIAAFGERGISGIFGVENNELHRKMYLQDPANQLVPLLESLFGATPAAAEAPRAFPAPFDTFRAWSMSFEGLEKSVQGDTDVQGEFDLLDHLPTFRGGITLDIAYRPLDDYNGFRVTDETWDFASQTMSMIGNNFGQNPNNIVWESDGVPITNLTAIIKIIPKVEFTQRQTYRATLPDPAMQALIGCVNDGPLTMGAVGAGARNQYPEECVLLSGLPAVRRWRFDGRMIFESGVKMAVNVFKDTLADGSTGYVTWNRLYRPKPGYWDRVLLGESQKPLYRSDSLWQVVQ